MLTRRTGGGGRRLGVRTAFLSARPWSFTMTFSSVTMGALLAALAGKVDLPLYFVTLGGMVAFHAATNILNDYYDVKHGVDKEGAPTTKYRLHPGAAGDVPLSTILGFSLGLYAVTLAAAAYLSTVSGPAILLITGAGVLGSVLYTADPIVLKARGAGEATVFVMWGLLIPLGAYMVQARGFSWVPMAGAVPIGLFVALVLLANNIRDIGYDGSVDTRTVAVRLGEKAASRVYGWLLALAYAFVLGEVLSRFVSAWSLLVLLTLPGAIQLWRMFRGPIPDNADPKTAALALQFALLYMASLVLSIYLPVV
ncbi:MAG: prenyltransferase [Nitrososphaerota archaeon]|jgi:1,4-dihydroxy-2-naphthoate octaprenyltransferase|nr:prenyltransferase [Nitrososphaerota archaeon]MDG6957826.1 prenyltransferase [Nitrososphaerota archaeon]MDG6959691.1 prenyltransferase [Nitrososphaerota archaeon]MDG6965061.1 prenyltransferase [Nitrososphaerota archaeon]MDG6968109.1 prenyltransferase [Nitrososphaerota archaeon]